MKLESPATISLLPEELLTKIFLSVLWHSTSASEWITVTQVCRAWRFAAISSKLLWSLIYPSNERIVSTCVFRAGLAPLRIRWMKLDKDPDLRTIKPYAHRVVDVYLSLGFGPMESFFSEFQGIWDKLVNLSLVSAVAHDASGTRRRNVYVDMSQFAAHPPPALQKLQLQQVVPKSWNTMPKCRHLRILRLVYLSKSRIQPTMDQFIHFLEGFPALEQLFLIDTGPKPEERNTPRSDSSTRHKVVQLNNLRILVLVFDTGSEIAHLLARLLLPATTSVTIEIQRTVAVSGSSGFLECFPHGQKPSNLPFLAQLNDVCISVNKTARNISIKATRGGGLRNAPSLHIRAQYDDERDSAIAVLLQLGSLVPAPLESLELHVRMADLASFMECDWRTILSPQDSLKSLVIRKKVEEEDHESTILGFQPLIDALTRAKPDQLPLVPRLENVMLPIFCSSTIEFLVSSFTRCQDSRLVDSGKVKVFDVTFENTSVPVSSD